MALLDGTLQIQKKDVQIHLSFGMWHKRIKASPSGQETAARRFLYTCSAYSVCSLHTKLEKLLHASLLHLPLYSSIFTLILVSAVTLRLFTLGLSPLLQLISSLIFFSIHVNISKISLEKWLCHHLQTSDEDMCANTHTYTHSLCPYCLIAQAPNSNISTGTCIGNCPCGKTSKPPHCEAFVAMASQHSCALSRPYISGCPNFSSLTLFG